MKALKIIGSIATFAIGIIFTAHAFSTDGTQLASSILGGMLNGGGITMFVLTLQS